MVVVIEIYDICGHYFKLEEGGLRGSTVGSPFLMEINGQSMGGFLFLAVWNAPRFIPPLLC